MTRARMDTGIAPDVIAEDRPCTQCGYNLRGLTRADRCPECGRAIISRKTADDPPLSEAPLAYLHVLNVSAIAAAASALLGPISVFYAVGWAQAWAALVAGVATGVWAASVVMLTQPKPRFGDNPRPEPKRMQRLRLAARLTQLAWPMFSLCVIAWAFASGAWMTAAAIAAWSLAIVGVLGFVPTAICFAELSDWARDTSLSGRLRGCAWFITFAALFELCTIAVGLVLPFFAGFLMFGQLFVNIAFFLALLVFVAGVIQLAGNTAWAISNHKAAQAKAMRDVERAEAERRRRDEEAERLGSDPFTVAPPPAPSRPPPLSPFEEDVFAEPAHPANAPRPGQQTQRIERPDDDDVEIYELAPEDPPRR